MNTILEKITENKNKQVYYNFMCDDRRAKEVKSDYSFGLGQTDELNDLLEICNENHYNYTLEIQEWCEMSQEIKSTIKLVDNNFKNIN